MKARVHFNAGTELGALLQSWRSKFLCWRGCRASNKTLLETTSGINSSPNLLRYSLRHYSIHHRIAIFTPQLYLSNLDWERSRSQRRALHTSSLCLSSSKGRLVSQKDAEQFIANLLPTEREVLEKALVKQKIPEDVGGRVVAMVMSCKVKCGNFVTKWLLLCL